MRCLLDTGILLRLVHPTDALHQDVCDALALLKGQGHTFYRGMQNISEFWNVTTRPATSRGGFGLSPQQAEVRLGTIEQGIEVLTDSPASYSEWKRCVVRYSISGVQVHDAKLAALMITEGIDHLLTLNPTDFKRFSGLTITTPQELLKTAR